MKYVNICIFIFIKSTETLPRCITIFELGIWLYIFVIWWYFRWWPYKRDTKKKNLFKFLLRHTVSGTWKMAFWEDDSISNYIFFRIDCGIWKQVFSRQLSIRAINPLFYKYTKSSPMPLFHTNIYWLRGKTSPKKVWEFFKEENPMSRKIISKIETQTWFLKTGRFWKDLTSMCRRVT